jgi:LysM repeat protein
MNRSRVSMVVAAAGLVLVGLLAAALFTPGKPEPTEDLTANKDDVQPLVPTEATLTNPLYPLEVPAPVEPAPAQEIPKPEPKPEPKPQANPAPATVEKPAEPKPAPKGGIVEHTIVAGDMISRLAVRYGCSVNEIYRVNDGLDASNAHRIRVGQVVRIPVGGDASSAVSASGPTARPSGEYFPRRVITAEPGDTSFSLAIEYFGSMQLSGSIRRANSSIDWSERLRGGEQIVLPEHGTPPDAVATNRAGSETVQRGSLIPQRR